MKKLLLPSLLLAGVIAPASAQNYYLLHNGEPVENGATIVSDEFSYEDFEAIPGYAQWELKPNLVVISEVDANLSINAKSNLNIQLCTLTDPNDPTSGQCAPGTDVTKSPVMMVANDGRALDLEVIDYTSNGETEFDFPEYNVTITITSDADPDTEYVVYLTMGGFKGTAGVDSLESGLYSVSYNGGALNYDLPVGSQLSLYSLSGKTVLNKNVSGSGSLSLEGLSKGIYLYRVSGKYSKTAKIIIK